MTTDGILHPESDRLEAYVEGTLDDSDHAVVESHLVSCARCQVEVEEWKAMFSALAALPHFEPAPGFADRVMAGVFVHKPWTVRAAELIRRLIPSSTAGWMLATALLALPVVSAGGAVAWLLSKPTITPMGLWLFTRERMADGLMAIVIRVGTALMESNTVAWLRHSAGPLVADIGTAQLGAAAALFAALMLTSLWILYDNLFRTPTREEHYVMRCI